jgi:uncharacterized protein YndB with AHSA1/START domain
LQIKEPDMSEPTKVERTVDLPAPVSTVWEAVTEEEQLAAWFDADVELDVRPGGRGVFRGNDGETRRAAVEVVEPERRLAFRWWPEGDAGSATRVEVELEEIDDGTRLVVIERPLVFATTDRWSGPLSRLEARCSALVGV